MGSLTGSVFGAIVITLLPELLRKLPGDFSKYRLVVYSALLIIIMLTRPQGILGTREFGLSWLRRLRQGSAKEAENN
jgi:branched-chain amino acid transport system permease protein